MNLVSPDDPESDGIHGHAPDCVFWQDDESDLDAYGPAGCCTCGYYERSLDAMNETTIHETATEVFAALHEAERDGFEWDGPVCEYCGVVVPDGTSAWAPYCSETCLQDAEYDHERAAEAGEDDA